MNRESISEKLSLIFRSTFEEPEVVVSEEMTAKDVKGWNSVTHIDMLCEVEDQFGIGFTTAEIAGLARVGQLIDLIDSKKSMDS